MSSKFRKLFTITFVLFLLGSPLFSEARCSHVLITDFRNVNLFEAFYSYDKNKKEFEFTPITEATYKRLSVENKIIYKKVKKSDSLYKKSQSHLPEALKIAYLQRAYGTNCYNLPAANALVNHFEKNKKYSTALYYALQVKKYDTKNKYPDIDYKIGNLYYSLGYTDESLIYFEKAQKSLNKTKNNPELLKEVSQKIKSLNKTGK